MGYESSIFRIVRFSSNQNLKIELDDPMARLTIEEMRTIAAHRGGFCLLSKYINNKTKLKWQCSKKHI